MGQFTSRPVWLALILQSKTVPGTLFDWILPSLILTNRFGTQNVGICGEWVFVVQGKIIRPKDWNGFTRTATLCLFLSVPLIKRCPKRFE